MSDINELLFAEFQPVTTHEWEEKIKEDLKGADYDKKLIWKTLEGIAVKPYYRAEHIENLKFIATLPNDFPFVRSNKLTNNWEIRQDIDVDRIGIVESNRCALYALNRGATSLGFITENTKMTESGFSQLVKGIVLNAIELNFVSVSAPVVMLKLLAGEVKRQEINPKEIKGSVSLDPYGNLTISGNFCDNADVCYNSCKDAIEFAVKELPEFKVIAVSGHFFHNAGAGIVQELAFSLAVGHEYLVTLTDKGLLVNDIAPRMQFNFAVGTNYFMEIAKLRAARMLWAKIVDKYNPCCHELTKMYIHTSTSLWNKTTYDPYVNMLRTTTESMSAIIGGTNSLTVTPFDSAFKSANDFGLRIARNQQIILKEESNLDKVVDPAAGSYYIENLTNSIAEYAWKLFLEVENKDGYFKAFAEGFVQTQIEATANARNLSIANRREILLGTNQFPNLHEKIIENIDNQYNPFIKGVSDLEPIARPLKMYRGAKAFEELRLKTEEYAVTPKVFLLTYGNLAMLKARAMFSTNFFACAGFEVIDNAGFKTIEEGIHAAIESKAGIVVICSSDDEYAQIVPPIFNALKDKTIVVLAGYPANLVEQFKAIGLRHFIHVKSNILETLQNFQKELAI